MTRKASFVYKYLYQTEKKMWQEKKKTEEELGCLSELAPDEIWGKMREAKERAK